MEAEFEEGREALGENGLVAYKFFSLFRAKGTEVSYGKLFTHKDVDPEVVNDIRVYVKAQKEWVKTRPSARKLCLRMWWLVQKIMDYGLFDSLAQRHMLFWFDTCSDLLTERSASTCATTSSLG
jgi:hypothetical protein